MTLPPPRFNSFMPIEDRGPLMMKPLTVLLIAVLALLAIALTVSAATDGAPMPGDPTGPDDLVFVDLDVGAAVSCGVTKANNIRCWGNLRSGPVIAEGFVDVAVGKGHTCGLKTDGTVHCWGTSLRNRLEIPTTDDETPLVLSTIDAHGNGYHTCGIRESDDSAVCWGWDFSGTSSGMSDDPGAFTYDYSEDTFSDLSAGNDYTCGVLSQTRDIRCWGGYNDLNSAVVPNEHIDTEFKSVHPGSGFFTCALTVAGEAVCWGRDTTGVVTDLPDGERFEQFRSASCLRCYDGENRKVLGRLQTEL